MQRRQLAFLVSVFAGVTLCVVAGAQPATRQTVDPDPYMGDWQGTVTVDGVPHSVAVAMIPHGGGAYRARFFSTFANRVPALFDVQGWLRNGAFRAVDLIPFDVGHVLSATDKGVVLDASLWTGKLDGGKLEGTISGSKHGAFTLSQTKRTSPTLGQKPPAGAVVLFDGTNLDAWQPVGGGGPPRWKLVEGKAMEVHGGGIKTKQAFSNFRLHLEFRTPYMPTARGQRRGNSGVYVQGRYEVQVLDSYGLDGADNECGGIYHIARPAVNMCFPPLQWQTYDITFHAARFDDRGKKTAPAHLTVVHNGVTIHDNLALPHVTPGGVSHQEAPAGPLMLQDHGNPVRYRNIWIKKMD